MIDWEAFLAEAFAPLTPREIAGIERCRKKFEELEPFPETKLLPGPLPGCFFVELVFKQPTAGTLVGDKRRKKESGIGGEGRIKRDGAGCAFFELIPDIPAFSDWGYVSRPKDAR